VKRLPAVLLALSLTAVTAFAASAYTGTSAPVGGEGGVALVPAGTSGGFMGALPGVVDPDQYRIGPGDQFVLWIWGPISRTLTLTVGPEGDVLIPDIGPVTVSGRSLRVARQMLLDRVHRMLRGVDADAQLSRLRTLRVYLSGQVTHPGPVVAMGTNRIVDVLADSLLGPGASRRNVEVRRADGSRTIVDVLRFQITGVGAADPWLSEGDVVQVPLATHWVGIWGAVGRSGTFEMGPHDSVSTLLELAGGLMSSALSEDARLVRWRNAGERETLSVSFRDGRVADGNVPLRDGDQLYVLAQPGYHESQQVAVVGRVAREGTFPIRLGVTRLTEIVRAAGGFLPDADRSSIHLVRTAPNAAGDPEFDRLLKLSRGEMTTSEYEAFRSRLAAHSPDVRVDWLEIEAGRTDLDLLLQDGDIIRVERRTAAVRVDGQVHRPGLIPYVEGRDISYYVSEAGGFTRRGARTQVRLTRAANGQSMLARDAMLISPGDQVWVPERPDVSPWQYLRDVLVVGVQIATLYIAVRK
jgi:protein involved in polysaccharide export with SLBB domain